ncbi:uncharacterized protein CXorf65 homolog isoform X6 [Pelodiscus sinensis]|uniref:uncharacterized protein CXorf65 homolog isoform X6 n=1 Tax=Pelodiscus sinensis TaxID=13735 RepID=UPI003F6B07C8
MGGEGPAAGPLGPGTAMFICVKHGGPAVSLPDNQQFLANTCCSVLLLLHYLRSKVGLRRRGTKQENAYRAFTPVLQDPEPELLDALRTQCDFLEKSRLKLLRAQDGKKLQTMESLISIVPSQISGKGPGRPAPGTAAAAEEEGGPRKAGPAPKVKGEASKKEKHR